MKIKIAILMALQCALLLLSSNVFGQITVTVPASNPSGTGSTASAYRKPLGSNRAYERSAMIYKHSEFNQLGTINSIAFLVDSLNLPGNTYTRIFIKEVLTDTMVISTVALAEAGATLVFDDTLFAPEFILGEWIVIPLTTAFVHASTLNIQIVIETNSGTTIGTDINTISKGFRYFDTGDIDFQYWESPANNPIVPFVNGIGSVNRPNIQFGITPFPPCITPPNAGTIVVSNDSICIGNNTNLSLNGADLAAGIIYKWLSSNDGVNWNVISGETNPSYNPIINADSIFACVLTCMGVSDTTPPVNVYLKPFYNCYCVDNLGGNCTAAIDSVGITTTTLQNGSSGCVNPYTAFPNNGNTTATLAQGATYQLGTKYTGNTKTSMWIDYNHNGNFDNNEWRQVCLTSVAGVQVLSNFTVPANALLGVTGMRFRSSPFNLVNDSSTTCVSSASGEIEDYLIEIGPPPPCSGTPEAGITIASEDSVCIGNTVDLSLFLNTNALGITFQWISSSNGINWSAIIGENQSTYSAVITSDSIFACAVTCAGLSDTSIIVNITLNSYLNCYCNTNLGGDCATTDIDSIGIVSTTLANGLTGCAPSFYTLFPNSGATTGDLIQGQTYSLVSRFGGTARAACWIDFNQNGVFETNEWTLISNAAAGGVDVITNINVPLSANLGQTRIRIRSRSTQGTLNDNEACATFGSGETEDYTINIIAAPPCIAPPDAGMAVAASDSVCSGNTTLLNLNSNTTGLGTTFQWISSNDGVNWSSIAGENQFSYSPTIISDSIFACVVTCSSLSDTSALVNVYVKSFLDCYCSSGLGGNCTNTAINSVSIISTTLSNLISGCAPGNYTLFPASGLTTANVVQGQTYSLVTRYNGTARSACWIDLNQNGVFDISEWVLITNSTAGGVDVVTSIDIPITANLGQTRMRIRSRSNQGTINNDEACGNFGTGETEDYILNIVAGGSCIAPPDAGVTEATQDSVCVGNTTLLTLNANTTGSGTTYQWLSSNDGVNFTEVIGENLEFYSPTITSDSIFACIVTCSSQSDTSALINITLNAQINCYCNTNLGGDCASTAIDSVAIISTTLANGITGCAPTFYTSYPASGFTTANLFQGQTYTLVSKYNGVAKSSCWIDYNQNGVFDANEWTLISNATSVGADVYTLLNIPLTAAVGQTRMRIRTRSTQGANTATDACATFGSGETEDYIINILATSTCVAPPDAGFVFSSQDSVCVGTNIFLTLNSSSTGTGITFQWISSGDGLNWDSIIGEDQTFYSPTINSDSIFACVITCSGLSDTSSFAPVYLSTFYDCYCTLNVGGNCAASAIDSIAITTTTLQNGPTGCAPTSYTTYPNTANTTADLTLGQTYELVARFNANVRTSMWIDYNHNSVFDTYEWIQVCQTSIANTNIFANFTVPTNALTGLTGMRVRSRVTAGVNDSTTACANFGTGEIEDYLITINQIVGLQSNDVNNNINVFPNPSNGHFTISSLLKIKQVNLYDVCGKEVNFNSQQINTKQSEIIIANKGVYFLQVTDVNAVVKTHKVVVN